MRSFAGVVAFQAKRNKSKSTSIDDDETRSPRTIGAVRVR